VDILDPDYIFDLVALDSQVDVINDNISVVKTVDVLAPVSAANQVVLTSTNGSTDSGSILGATSIQVTDTVNWGTNSELESLTNNFTQTQSTPEPGTIVGLLVAGTAGIVSRRRKQVKI
jgi:hypothetical protein